MQQPAAGPQDTPEIPDISFDICFQDEKTPDHHVLATEDYKQ